MEGQLARQPTSPAASLPPAPALEAAEGEPLLEDCMLDEEETAPAAMASTGGHALDGARQSLPLRVVASELRKNMRHAGERLGGQQAVQLQEQMRQRYQRVSQQR
jgi:hypothetical protein